MDISATTLHKLDWQRIQDALAQRAFSSFGQERARNLQPNLSRLNIETAWQRLSEALSGTPLSLGGVHDIRPLIAAVEDGKMLDGREILEFAYTLDAASTIKRAIAGTDRPALEVLAAGMSSFDAVLRLVREQLDSDGSVRDDASPKLRDIRRRLNPLRGRIRSKMQELLERYSEAVQDPIVTMRRDRYVIPIKANHQSFVSGIILDSSDSGATVFIEPQAVVPLNNELALLQLEERDEVRRILIALAQRLVYADGLERTLEILAELDFIAASARLCEDWQLHKPEFAEDDCIHLRDIRHPLIDNCVPNSLELASEERLLIVTGPNAGGKTVLLKTLGLSMVMAHSGLFVATKERSHKGKNTARIPYIARVLSDIGDEQSIEASLSTYAGHLTNLKRIVEEADHETLILIDELGSGTDPAEGAALSQAVIERILASEAWGLINTHLAPLKVFASETAGVQNAAMQFDVEKLRPRFELLVGQPGRSYALSIAERIGLDEDLLLRADHLLGEKGAELEQLLESLEQQRQQLQKELDEAENARKEAVSEAKILRKQISSLRQQEDKVMAAAAQKADRMLQDTLEQAKELKKTAQTDQKGRGKALEDIQKLRKTAQTVAKKPYKQSIPSSKAKQPQNAPRFSVGMNVKVESYGAEGPIVEIRADELVVQLGLLKVTVPKHEAKRGKQKAKQTVSGFSAPTRFEEELNLRGERVEPALEKIRDYLLEAYAMRRSPVRLLHGKGTGTLRDAVRNYLKNDPNVERYEDAVPYEGGHGVTLAYLRLPA